MATRAPLLPALVFMIIMTQLPFVATLVISFMNWNALYPNDRGFAGLDNFKTAFTDPDLRNSIFNTILYTVVIVLVAWCSGSRSRCCWTAGSGAAASCGRSSSRRSSIVPVAAALLWKHAIFNPEYGLLNGMLTWVWRLFGSDSPPQPDWITNTPKLTIMVAADLAVDAVHDADPAGRPAGPARWTSSRRRRSTARARCRSSGT